MIPKSIADSVREHRGVASEPFVDKEAAEEAREKAEEKGRLRQALIHLSSLRDHEGWLLFKAQLDADYELAVINVLRETDAVKLARASGAAFALRVQRDWLESQLQGLHESLK